MSIQLSDSRLSDIRERLEKFMTENPSSSNRSIGNNIGFSPGYVSQFRNNKFPSKDTESDFAMKVEDYLNNEEKTIQEGVNKGTLKFAMTTAAQDIFKVTDYALTEGIIGVVAGVPGCGKTISVNEYKNRKSTSVLIEVTPLVTVRSLIQDICLKLKIPIYNYHREHPQPISNQTLFKEIIKQLEGTRRILILDEGENLTTSCIEVVRRIQDFTGIGLLLSGTPKLLDRLRGPRKELQQLFSRVGLWKEINLLQIGDVRAILQINFPEALRFANTFLQLSKNNGRLLQHLITLVKRTTIETGEDLSDDLIDEAADSLLT